jgi:EpsI family protein
VRQPLESFPLTLGEWEGRIEPGFTQQILNVLRVDDYMIRTYHRGQLTLGLYVGYHATQRQGSSIHSPLNCLPGAGWIPVVQERRVVSVHSQVGGPERKVEINRVVIAKGIDRRLVLYWYQSHGRVVASEYWGKAYSVYDAVRLNRTDAALVRVIAPIADGGNEELLRAERDATAFVQELFPLLADYLPS